MRVDDLDQLTHFQDKLNPQLWVNNRLKPQVRLALFKIAKEFLSFINIADIKLTDITVSGSNASFNYTPMSDIDLHLIADINGPCEVNLKEMFLAKKSSFNDQHDINIFGHSVEVYVQNSDEKHISNGIYSVYNDNWIKFPKKITAQPDISNIEDKFEYLHNEIDQAVDSGDRETIERLKKKIKTMRQSGLDKDGEYGVDNLAFKLLRNEGDIEKLYKAGTEATDTELSLSQQGVAEGLDQDIPSVLYHATYKPRLKSIQSKGLGSGGKRNWEDSQRGVVYLALDPDVAESYAETSDMVPDEWLDQIVMLKISTAGLDPNKFGIDSNVQDNAGDTIEYHGVIPVSNISLYKSGVAEGLSESRNSLFAFVKQQFPTWPDYVLKDFLYQQAKGIRDQAELDDFLKRNKQDFGNCKWTLTKLPITVDIFTPKTQRMLASREGGSSNPFQVPRDAERHAQQSQMIQQKGVSAEPIIVAKLSNGYDLIEGWHRTIQHLKAFPQGYTGPAWVCTGATYKSESVEQGVAEGNAFLGALNTARKNNLEYFIVDGKKYKVKKNKKIVKEEELSEKWSKKYKRSIDCSHPKGFSQKAHCAGRKKK